MPGSGGPYGKGLRAGGQALGRTAAEGGHSPRLVQQPRLILADEPVASLDPATSASILSLLHSVCKEDGIPAIVSLHQVDWPSAFADRVVGLSQGRVVYDGEPAGLCESTLDDIYSCAALAA
jgi:phosphonate transport system ATP-binding protein